MRRLSPLPCKAAAPKGPAFCFLNYLEPCLLTVSKCNQTRTRRSSARCRSARRARAPRQSFLLTSSASTREVVTRGQEAGRPNRRSRERSTPLAFGWRESPVVGVVLVLIIIRSPSAGFLVVVMGIQGTPPCQENPRESRKGIHENPAEESRCLLRRREESKKSHSKIHLPKPCVVHCVDETTNHSSNHCELCVVCCVLCATTHPRQ